MTRAALSKREFRERTAQLQALMREWDPIGVLTDPSWPTDEYECLVGPLLTRLSQGASEEDITRYLRHELQEHFGLSPDNHNCAAVAQRTLRWFDLGWRRVEAPVTIFVALVGEGVDVWRPVQARPLDSSHFRIVGAERDTREEHWQFSTGAIVKCENRQFADGSTGAVAVEQVGEAG